MKVSKRVKLTKVRRARFSLKALINPKTELFRWGPLDAYPVYTDIFNYAFVGFTNIYKSWPDMIDYYYNNQLVITIDYQKLRISGKKNFEHYILDDHMLNGVYRSWMKDVRKLRGIHRTLSSGNLSNLNSNEFVEFYKLWFNTYCDFWINGLLPEVANWGGEMMLSNLLKKKVPKESYALVFEKLSAPDKLSYYNKAELELLKLKKIRHTKIFKKRIVDYYNNYYWIYSSYHGSKKTPIKFFKNELDSTPKTEVGKKIDHLVNLSGNSKAEKRRLLKQYKLGSYVAKVAERLCLCIWWQDLRKYYIFMALSDFDIFLKEISSRRDITTSDLMYYSTSELYHLVTMGQRVDSEEIRNRKKHLLVVYQKKGNNLSYIPGRQAKILFAPYQDTKDHKGISDVRGLVVSSGPTKVGKVRIIRTVSGMSKIKKNEILVTPMTTPDYIIAIRKAAAIVTDEGGMTCHAAIVSRELGIPCIVGTKVATKVFKEGDLVEVDTVHGRITRLTT